MSRVGPTHAGDNGVIVSHRHKFVFVHINKCAGTSIAHALIPYLSNTDIILGCTTEFEKLSDEGFQNGGLWKHSKAQEARAILGEEIWRDYFTFSFVRNPWDLVLSEYEWWLKTKYDNEHNAGVEIKAMKDYSEYVYSKYCTRRNCLDFVSDNVSTIIVDFVGRQETLQQDFDTVMETIGLSKTKLPESNTTEHEHYSRYYTRKIRKLIAEFFAKDIEAFGYRFDGMASRCFRTVQDWLWPSRV